jgi:hypothetical protein
MHWNEPKYQLIFPNIFVKFNCWIIGICNFKAFWLSKMIVEWRFYDILNWTWSTCHDHTLTSIFFWVLPKLAHQQLHRSIQWYSILLISEFCSVHLCWVVFLHCISPIFWWIDKNYNAKNTYNARDSILLICTVLEEFPCK